MENEFKKDQIIATVIDILVDVIGYMEKQDVLAEAHLTLDLHINSDDLTVFAMQVVKHFGIKPTLEEWREVGTIQEVAELVLTHETRTENNSTLIP